MVLERELKKWEAKLRRARRMNIRRNKHQSNLSSIIRIENNVSETRKGPGRPKSNVGSASKAMNFIQIVSHFSGSNQGTLLSIYVVSKKMYGRYCRWPETETFV